MRAEPLPVRMRCACGALYDEDLRYCPECGEPRTYVKRELQQLAAVTGEPVEDLQQKDRAGVLTVSLPTEVRSNRLQRAIAAFTAEGYEVVSQTETGAQLKQPKRISWLLAIIFLIFTAGLGLLIYLVYVLVSSGKLIYLSVDERGTVSITGDQDPDLRGTIRELNEAV